MKNILFIFIFTLIFSSFLYSNNSIEKYNNPDDTLKYIFIAHTYLSKTTVDYRLEELDFKEYDNTWLGGDILGKHLANTTPFFI